MATEAHDSTLGAQALCGLGHCDKAEGRLESALHYYSKYLDASNESGQKRGSARAHMYMGEIHLALRQQTEATEHYRAAVDEARLGEDHATEAQACMELVALYLSAGENGSAEHYRSEGRRAAEEVWRRAELHTRLQHIGMPAQSHK